MAIRLGVIGGAEVTNLLLQGVIRGERHTMQTPFGDTPPVYRVASGPGAYYLLPRHGEDGSLMNPTAANARASLYTLKQLGVQAILAWSGPAALVPDLPVGALVMPDDLLDFTCRSGRTFFEDGRLGQVAPSPVFCPTLRAACERALGGAGFPVTTRATYVCVHGPRFETPAEARLFASWGGTLVGMTLCPEAFLARELAICYAPLCWVTGHAAGLANRTAVAGKLYKGLADDSNLAAVENAAALFPQVIAAIVKVLAEEPDDWACRRALVADRDPTLMATDWHEWFRA